MKARTIIEMRDGLRGDRLIRSAVSRGGDVEATKRYMLQEYLRYYVYRTRDSDRDWREELVKTRRAIKWVIVQEDEFGQEVKPEAGGETL